jgi:hypothetical protein
MTEKDKAIELVSKYMMVDTHDEDHFIIRQQRGKKCALIAVDEIINSNPYKLSLEGEFLTEHITYDINFWQEVKKEIEKL